MFRVQVYQWVVATDGAGWLDRELALPFAPSPGLVLDGISRSEDGLTVDLVAWDAAGQRFRVYLEHDTAKTQSRAGRLGFYGAGWRFRPAEPGESPRGANGRPRE